MKTQADLQKTQSDLTAQKDLAKDLSEQNRKTLEISSSDLKSTKIRCQQLEAQYLEATTRICQLEFDVQNREVANIELAENGKEEEEDVESFKERIRELEAKLADKNKVTYELVS